jgi:hypothetical protein
MVIIFLRVHDGGASLFVIAVFAVIFGVKWIFSRIGYLLKLLDEKKNVKLNLVISSIIALIFISFWSVVIYFIIK